MDDVYRVAKKHRSFEFGEYEIMAEVFPVDTSIPSKKSKIVNLIIDEKIPDELAQRSTVFGTAKFVIGEREEESKSKRIDCGGKYCITKENYKEKNAGKLIQEINIRLAGFGGNVPTEEFDNRTEATIKQFQRDYMHVPETGKICGSLLRAIDEFSAKYDLSDDIWQSLKCKCGKCKGFGEGKYSEEKGNTKIAERKRKYEYPGMHRSLLFGLRALLFYVQENENFGYHFSSVSSGYRCWVDNKKHKRGSTNHMGKAVDLQFNKSKISDVENIRDKIIIPNVKAQIRWKNENRFSLEPTRESYKGEFTASSWIHIDVREFNIRYLSDTFFVKKEEDLDCGSIVDFAKKMGIDRMCNCIG
jgi:hypothetical protein